MQGTSEGQAAEFLAAAWGSTQALREEVGGRIGLFCLPSSASLSFDSIEEAAKEAARLAGAGVEVYVRVTALRAGYPAKSAKRGTVEDSVAVPGLAIDLDLQLPDRKKPQLFESIAEAQDLLDKLALRPTVVVATGGGLQAWWMLREPLTIGSTEEREAAQRLARGWHETVLAAAARAGRTIDSTHDLARVMRLPGTYNNKRGAPVPVRIIDGPHGPERRYSVDDIETFSLAEAQWVGGRPKVAAMGSVVEGLVLSALAEPPADKFAAIMANEPGFKASWDRQKKLAGGSSASEFDLSLASYAAAAKWEDQEIANLLIASRRRHGDDLKLREGYYALTIRKARSNIEFDELSAEIATSGAAGEDGRAKVLQAFTRYFNVELAEVICYMPQGDQLTFRFIDGRRLQCAFDDFKSWTKFWSLTVTQLRMQPDNRKPRDPVWLGLVSAVRQIARDVTVEETGAAARVAELCRALAVESGVALDSDEDTEEGQRAAAMRSDGAFVHAGKLWVRLGGLARIATDRRWDREYQREERLRAVIVEELGGEKRSKNARMREGRARRRSAAAGEDVGVAEMPRVRQVNLLCYGIELDKLRGAAGDAPQREEGE